jgi:prevent-host-death family protein
MYARMEVRMPVETVATVLARNHFSDLLNRVAFGRERIVLTRRERKIAAIIPIDDLERIMQLELPVRPPIRTGEDLARALEEEIRLAPGSP